MSQTLTTEEIAAISKWSPEKVGEFFTKWNAANAQTVKFYINIKDRSILGNRIAELVENESLSIILLETVKILSRDSNGLESLLNPDLCDKILALAVLLSDKHCSKNLLAQIEAQKCLVNTMYHSSNMRDRFYCKDINGENLKFYLSQFEESRRKVSKVEWIRQMSASDAATVWYLYHRIAFIATAMSKNFQKFWADDSDVAESLIFPVQLCIGKCNVPQLDINRANESLKTFFNVFCHFQGDVNTIDEQKAINACRALRGIICSDVITGEIVQSAIHALSVPPLPMMFSVLCADPKTDSSNSGSSSQSEKLVKEYDDMTFVEALIGHLDKQLTLAVETLNQNPTPKDASTATDLLGPYFQALARICAGNKYARRYCRLRVLPPLVAEEVKKRPEEHNTLRGKIVRIMMQPSATKDVASEFLFIICKRSVNRVIKYVGFGHSAGHLANVGLLGQINQPKRESDSEDSETEDYNKVKDSVNPVTGAMYPPDHGSAMAEMTEAQKEYEAMRLVDAMNRMMDAGVVRPGTIGEDGRVHEVSHVLELLKDAPEEKNSDESDDE